MAIAQLEPLRAGVGKGGEGKGGEGGRGEGRSSEADACVVDSVVGLLSTTLSESVTGYHM